MTSVEEEAVEVIIFKVESDLSVHSYTHSASAYEYFCCTGFELFDELRRRFSLRTSQKVHTQYNGKKR